MPGVSLFISCKNKIQCVCVKKKKRIYDQMGSVPEALTLLAEVGLGHKERHL